MSRTSTPAATRYIAFLLALFMVVALAPTQQAQAATTDDSPPVWWPLRGSNQIGCSYMSPSAVCGGTYHRDWAIDAAATRNEAIYAAGGGTVIHAVKDQGANCSINTYERPGDCPNGARGNSVTIDHGGGIHSFYTHFATVDVSTGDRVGPTTRLGGAGDSGWSSPGFVHLHYERRNADGTPLDPGPLKACVGGDVVTYPHAFEGDYTSWAGLPGQRFVAVSEGVDCARPPGDGGGGGGSANKVDVTFAIDTTGSMGPYIGAASAAAIAIADTTYATSDARIGLVEYKDLYSSCPSDGFAARVVTPFTASSSTFASGIGSLRATGGCDFPESVYSGIMTALEMPWRSDARKAVIVMGDARPHDPEQVTGYTAASVIAAARAGDVPVIGARSAAPTEPTLVSAAATADDAPTGVELYTINIGGGGSPYFEELAEGTGGQHYLASNPTEAVDQIAEALTEITSATLAVELGGPYGGMVAETLTFNADVTAGTADLYEWDFNGDGTYTASTSYPTATHTYDARFSGEVTLRATDTASGQSATSSAAVNVVEPVEVRHMGTKAGAPGVSLPAIAFVTGRDGNPVSGSTVTFTIGEQHCSATTAANGKAMCRITLDGPAGERTLVAYAEAVEGYAAAGTVETIRVAGSRGRGRG